MALRAQAPAKINRELRVGPRRADGYHEILSRFSSIDLADTIEVEAADDLRLSVEGATIANDATNLVVKAALLLAGRRSISPRAHLRLQKRVPVGGGLGGGSADAAITLLLLNRLWDCRLSAGELTELAALLGSDVPFFLVGGEADIAGRGERVTPRGDGPEEELLLLVPPLSLSTAQIYSAYDLAPNASERILPARLDVETSGWFFGPNDLASAVLSNHIEMTVYFRAAAAAAREYAMTGSGSVIALRGVTPDAAQQLARSHPDCRLLACRTLGRQEYLRRIDPSGGNPWR